MPDFMYKDGDGNALFEGKAYTVVTFNEPAFGPVFRSEDGDYIRIVSYPGVDQDDWPDILTADYLAAYLSDDPGMGYLVYPYRQFPQIGATSEKVLHIVSKLPKNYVEEYVSLDKIISSDKHNFSLQSRIMATINITRFLEFMKDKFAHVPVCLDADKIFINPANGYIKVDYEKLIDFNNVCKNNKSSYISSKGYLKERDCIRFAIYTAFRLLCGIEPYESISTYGQFPYLSKETISEMQKGTYGLVFEDKNAVAKWKVPPRLLFGEIKVAKERWRLLPGFFRRVVEQELRTGIDAESELTISSCLTMMLKLRDCLVMTRDGEKTKIGFWDPDQTERKRKYLKMDDYMIPFWPGKALYKYHFGEDILTEKSIVIGIITKNGKPVLTNKSDWEWYQVVGDQDVLIDSDMLTIEPFDRNLKIKIQDKIIEFVVMNDDSEDVSDPVNDDNSVSGDSYYVDPRFENNENGAIEAAIEDLLKGLNLDNSPLDLSGMKG